MKIICEFLVFCASSVMWVVCLLVIRIHLGVVDIRAI